MNDHTAPKSPRDPGVPDTLARVLDLGARTRHHRYFRDAKAFSLPVIAAILAQALIYAALFFRTGRTDWHNAGFAMLALAFVPILSAFTLCAFRRHQAPIIVAVAVVLVFFSFAVTLLSAFRIPLSYSGLAATLPAAMLVLAYANIRFHTSISGQVGLIVSDGSALVVGLLEGTDVALITHPETPVGAFDTILIDPGQHYTEKWSDLLAKCYLSGIEILPWNRFLEIRKGRVDTGSFDISHLTYAPSQIMYARAKRFLDLAAVVLTLPITVSLAAASALYIYLRDGGPVLFVQHRRGLGGRVFRMYKFRTMYKGTAGGATSTADKRIIPGCRLMRKLRLDELPQLYNILRGDMSLIGPRPVAEYVARATIKRETKYALRSLVLPGITGWAQVTSGYAESTEEEIEKLSYDLFYIKHLSFDLDLQILFRTIRTVLFGTGAR